MKIQLKIMTTDAFYEWFRNDNFFETISKQVREDFMKSASSYFEAIVALKHSSAYINFGSIPELYILLADILSVTVTKLLKTCDTDSIDIMNFFSLLFLCYSKQIDSHTSVDLLSAVYKKL